MSKTLFWYVFRDLLRVFFMTSLCMAGILSFGGLLKPFLQYGLNGVQMTRMMTYIMPAMLTYSLPISVLFATTIVYGRLSADSELIACRAGGISAISMAMPAIVLGLILSIVSLLSLSFIVPAATLRVEKVIFDSLADAVQKSVQRSHQIKFSDEILIFADRAEIKPPPPDAPDDEVVMLHGPMVCMTNRDTHAPEEFYTAKSATAVIRRSRDDEIQFSAYLEDCVFFPRDFSEKAIAGLGTVEIGPISHASPIRENTKFMDVRQLKKLYYDPTRSREIRELFRKITAQEQEADLVRRVTDSLGSRAQYRFDGENESYVMTLEPGARVEPRSTSRFVARSISLDNSARQVRLQRLRNNEILSTDEAKQVTLKAEADPTGNRMRVEFQMLDVQIGSGGPARSGLSRRLNMPMPSHLATMSARNPVHYLSHGNPDSSEVKRLRRKLPGLQSGILGEINARIAFAVSCAILVSIGAALGMMFRTGDYLSAFALSVIPALLSIALAATGQHICESSGDAWRLGVVVVWSANVVISILSVMLLGHLQRH